LVLRFHSGEDLPYRHTGPPIAQPAPTRDAVDVGDNVFRGQRAQLAVVERHLVLHRPENLEIPLRDVRLRYRAEMQERPAVGRGEGLTRWNARRIDALRNTLTFEERCHSRAV